MGHYASEMGHYEAKPPSQDELKERREARKAHREYLWALYNQYRAQGNLRYRTAACPECCAPIEFDDMPDHEDWHKSLMIQSIIGHGLF